MTNARESRLLWHSPVPPSETEECSWAREVAAHAHAGQRDKAGEPYFDHVQRVADAVAGEKAKTVAYLHDVLEKAPGWTLERLREVGFSAEVISAVRALTLQAGETKDALTLRATSTPLSLAVKRADLQDNLRQLEGKGESGAEYRRRLYLLDQASRGQAAPPEPRNDGELTGQRSARSPTNRDKWRIVYHANVAVRAVLAILFGLFVAAVGLAVWILVS